MILPHDYVTVTRFEDGELVTVAQLGAAEAAGIISHDLARGTAIRDVRLAIFELIADLADLRADA